jgi:uncharacterized protein (DUF1697 family)
MTLVAFLRGVNVGGHRTFRPSLLARELERYGVVNIGAAGTFIVRKPGSAAKFRAELARRLPFEAEVILCDRDELSCIQTQNPFKARAGAGVVRFVSVMAKAGQHPELPLSLPSKKDWLVRLVGVHDRFVFGEYRRHMKTIGYLGKLDAMFGATVTTRNWNTITTVLNALNES